MKRILALFTLLVAILMIAGPQQRAPQLGLMAIAATPAAATIVRCQDLVANTGSGLTFAWAGSAQTCANNSLIISRAIFVSWIQNTGSCAGGANSTYYQMTWQDMLNCKSSGVAQHTVTIASGSAYADYVCTYNATRDSTSCAPANPTNEPATIVAMSSSTVAPTSSATQLSISMTGLTYTSGCGAVVSMTVNLYNAGGANVATWSGITTATWSTPWSSSNATAGTYTWKASHGGDGGTYCASSDSGAGTFEDRVNWTGTSASSYY